MPNVREGTEASDDLGLLQCADKGLQESRVVAWKPHTAVCRCKI